MDKMVLAFEGVDGTGKTTLIRLLSKWLKKYAGIRTKPRFKLKIFNSVNTASIRVGNKLIDVRKSERDVVSQTLLFLSALRRVSWDCLRLSNDYHVIMLDRFVATHYAYSELIPPHRRAFCDSFTSLFYPHLCTPDVVILLTVNPNALSPQRKTEVLEDVKSIPIFKKVQRRYVRFVIKHYPRRNRLILDTTSDSPKRTVYLVAKFLNRCFNLDIPKVYWKGRTTI